MICAKDKNEEYLHSGKKMHAISSKKFHDFHSNWNVHDFGCCG